MPELPEVETTRRGIAPLVTGQRVQNVVVRQPRLRWRVPARLARELPGEVLHSVERRAKYLLLRADSGTAIIHLGMSGSLRVAPATAPPGPYDHVDIVLANGDCLRLRDPRRFGAVLWTTRPPEGHNLLRGLGPEPLDPAFCGDVLYQRSRGRRAPVKAFLMDSRVVAGLGNIYVNEALFRAGIHPGRAAGRIGAGRYDQLAGGIRATLQEALTAGGTTLRDFHASDGRPGYFSQQLRVYGREGEPCPSCQAAVRRRVIAQRSTYFCPRCQR
jgi:formamidopyrimidine-DNA glycosylase